MKLGAYTACLHDKPLGEALQLLRELVVIFLSSSGSCRLPGGLVVVESGEQVVEVLAAVVPGERGGSGVVPVLEPQDAFGEVVEIAEVAGLTA